MPVDLIIYAVVAVGLVLWLRSILGTRHGDERTRQNPLIVTPQDNTPSAAIENDIDALLRGGASVESAEDKIRFLLDNPQEVIGIDARAMAGLMDIAAADKNFDVRDFLVKVQDAFAIIVESFAQGDRETLESLLQPDVFTAFEGAIRDRESKEETQTTDVLSFKTARITDAALHGKTARVTVMFVARETTVVRASDGDIISGHPDKISEMRDAWVFARDVKSRDPRWLLAETKGNIEDDNLMIPNTDG